MALKLTLFFNRDSKPVLYFKENPLNNPNARPVMIVSKYGTRRISYAANNPSKSKKKGGGKWGAGQKRRYKKRFVLTLSHVGRNRPGLTKERVYERCLAVGQAVRGKRKMEEKLRCVITEEFHSDQVRIHYHAIL